MRLHLRLWHLLVVQVLLLASLVWAADSKLTALTELTTPASGDWLYAVDVSDTTDDAAGSSRKVRVDRVAWMTYALGSDYTNNSTTGTEVTGIGPMTVPAAGTYFLDCNLIVQSAATTTSPKFGTNYTGTATVFTTYAQFPSEGVTAVTGQIDDVANATTGQVWGYAIQTTETTTAPNLGPWTGVATANANFPIRVVAHMTVSDTGDIELWAGSEVASSQITIKAGSFCAVRRVA